MIRYTDIMEITVKPVSDTIDIGEGFFHTNQLGFFFCLGGGGLRLVIYQTIKIMQTSFIKLIFSKKNQSQLEFLIVTIPL